MVDPPPDMPAKGKLFFVKLIQLVLDPWHQLPPWVVWHCVHWPWAPAQYLGYKIVPRNSCYGYAHGLSSLSFDSRLSVMILGKALAAATSFVVYIFP
jgi:hypothetical protein